MARHFSDGTPMDVIEERDAWEDDVLSDYYKNAKDNYYTGDYDKVLVPENIMKNFTSFINKVTDDIAKKAIASDKSNKFTVNELVKIEKDIVKNELINSGVSNPDKYVKNIVKYINNEYQPLIDMIDDSYINGIEGLNNDVSTINNFIDADQNYSQDAAYANALQYACEDLDLYLLNIIKGEEGKKYILDSDFDATVAGVIDDVFGEEEYKELQNDKNVYYKLFDALVEHGLDQADKYGAPVIEDDDLKDKDINLDVSTPKGYFNKVIKGGVSDEEIEELAKNSLNKIAEDISDKDYFKEGYDALGTINEDIQRAFSDKWPWAGVFGNHETDEEANERTNAEVDIYNRILSSVINKLSTLNIPPSEYDKFEQAAKKLLDNNTDTPKEKSTGGLNFEDGVNAVKNKVFQDSNGKNYLAAEDVDEIIGDDYGEEYLDAVLRRLNAKLTDRAHPYYPYNHKSTDAPKDDYLFNQDEYMNDTIRKYLDKYHPDMTVEQWKNNIDDKEKIKFNRWFNDNDIADDPFGYNAYDIARHIKNNKVDDNGHKDYYSDRTLKNIINALDGRLL